MTYEDAKRIVEGVEYQKRSRYYHDEYVAIREVLKEFPDDPDGLYESIMLDAMKMSQIHAKTARILLGIEG